jgi:hypothetical protein
MNSSVNLKIKSPTKLGVVVASRGLMFSETLEELLGELQGFEYKFFWAHGKSLPQCFNDPVEEALADPDIFAVLICEDDMIIPKGILRRMFNKAYPVVALDYPFKNNGDSTMLHDPEGMALYSGTGFILIAKSILEALPKPIFRTDTAWDTMIKGETLVFWPRKLTKVAYGLHDVNLGIILFANSIPIMPMETTAGQRKLVKLGEQNTNNGAHEIKRLTEVGRDLVIKTVDEGNIYKYRQALARVKAVEIMDHIPEFIEYVDGQAVVRGMSYELV